MNDKNKIISYFKQLKAKRSEQNVHTRANHTSAAVSAI
jgi:hypothetical protein